MALTALKLAHECGSSPRRCAMLAWREVTATSHDVGESCAAVRGTRQGGCVRSAGWGEMVAQGWRIAERLTSWPLGGAEMRPSRGHECLLLTHSLALTHTALLQ